MKQLARIFAGVLGVSVVVMSFQNCSPSELPVLDGSSSDASVSPSSLKSENEAYANEYVEIRAPMILEESLQSPTGYHVFSSQANAGAAVFEFDLDESSSFQVEVRALADASSRNSLKVSVNGQAVESLQLAINKSYAWNSFSKVYKEAAGKQRISIEASEALVRVAAVRLKIVSSSSSVTPGPSVTPSPSPSASPVPSATPSPSPTVTPSPSASPSPTVTPSPTATPSPTVTPTNPSASKAPGQNFDLTLWKLTLPIDKNGTYTGSAMEVSPIGSTYSQQSHFYTASDGAMVFMAPATGATTSGSKYPRSELREMIAGNKLAAWTIDQGGSLTATVAVNEVPTTSAGAKGKVVIGQIHGPDDELCRLYYDNGAIYYVNDKSGSNGTTETKFELKSSSGAKANIPLNAKFDYKINIKDGKETVSMVYNGVLYSASETISNFWPGKALYFKAGVYVQVGKAGSGAGTVGTGQGKVSFYYLKRAAGE